MTGRRHWNMDFWMALLLTTFVTGAAYVLNVLVLAPELWSEPVAYVVTAFAAFWSWMGSYVWAK